MEKKTTPWYRRVDLAVAACMCALAVPKLVGGHRAEQAYSMIADHFAVPLTLFRLAAGAGEATVAVLILLTWARPEKHRPRFLLAAYVILLGTMAGALYTEFVIRPGKEPGLVALAVALVAASIVRLRQLRAASR
jgi:hypothetical protein